MITNRRSHFLNQLKLGSSGRRLYFDVQIPTAVKPLVLLLQELNLVRRFHRLNQNMYRVFPTYSRYRKSSRQVTFYTKISGRIRLSLKSLRILNINSPHSYYILETSRGLMTHKEALKLGQGGLLLLIIR